MGVGRGMADSQSLVLVVDDDPGVSGLLRRALELNGYAVEVLAEGQALLDRLSRGGVDLVLLDLMLPDANGLDLCTRLRALPVGAHVPVILLTGLIDDQLRPDGLAAGADDFATKPFNLDELLDRVAHWIATPTAERLEQAAKRAER